MDLANTLLPIYYYHGYYEKYIHDGRPTTKILKDKEVTMMSHGHCSQVYST